MKGDKIVQACDRHSNETETLGKHIPIYTKMWKLMVEFLRKSERHYIKIAQVISICITKSINLHTLILYGVGVHCDVDIFKLTTLPPLKTGIRISLRGTASSADYI